MHLLAVTLSACSWPASAPVAPPPTPPVSPPEEPPVAADPNRIEQIAVGESTTCVVRGDGTTQCRGKLPLPRTVLGGPPAVSDHQVCARWDGRERCLRPGIDQVRPTPFVELAHGAGAPCGRDGTGAVFCFYGQSESDAELRQVELPRPAVRVVADAFREYALLDDGALVTWDPYEAMFRSPRVTEVDHGVVEIDGTYLWTCWRSDDAVSCRAEGKVKRIRGITRPEQLTVGRKHACALQDGVPYCWGDSAFGQLGRRRSSREVAVAIDGIEAAASIDAGDDHTCVLLRESGDLSCWGRNQAGQVAGVFPSR